jgi:GDPmannose 4,6-dehydratase
LFTGLVNKTRVYQVSSSELYGLVQQVPQTEKTPFYPRSPYGVAKLYAYWITVNYREAYNMHASNGILFNHEPPIRGETFVTRKITRALARIVLGMQQTLFLGNLSSRRDWGHARDYIRAMHLILQQDVPDDYVIATGITTSIRDFVKMTGEELGIEISFTGENENEKGFLTAIDEKLFSAKVGEHYLEQFKSRIQKNVSSKSAVEPLVSVDPQYFRPTEVELLIGDATKSREKLGWIPKYDLQGLISDMIHSDIALMKKDAWLREGGYRTLNYFE